MKTIMCPPCVINLQREDLHPEVLLEYFSDCMFGLLLGCLPEMLALRIWSWLQERSLGYEYSYLGIRAIAFTSWSYLSQDIDEWRILCWNAIALYRSKEDDLSSMSEVDDGSVMVGKIQGRSCPQRISKSL
jgi:hypothetical protein